MMNLEEEYYFICSPHDREDLPFLSPDEATAELNYNFEALPLGQKPLKFENGWREQNIRKGVSSPTPPILFSGTDLVIDDKYRERLIKHGDIPNLHIYPAIYVDDTEKWHENYWFLTFTERFDCWDRKTSDYDQEGPPIRLGGLEYHQVYRYMFDQELMRKTPLEQRLLFKMGGTIDAYIVAHISVLVKFFGSPGANGAEYIRVSDY